VTWKARRRPAERQPAHRLALLAQVGGLAGQRVGALVERRALAAASSSDAASAARSHAALTQTGEPSAARDPAGQVFEFTKAANRGAVGRPWSSPSTAVTRKPSQGAGGAALDGQVAVLALGRRRRRARPVRRGAQPSRMVRIGAHQGVQQRLLDRFGQAQRLGAGLQALLAGGRGGRAVLDGQQAECKVRARLGGVLRGSPAHDALGLRPASVGVPLAPLAQAQRHATTPGSPSPPPPPTGSVLPVHPLAQAESAPR
jgi:hypothetical protein